MILGLETPSILDPPVRPLPSSQRPPRGLAGTCRSNAQAGLLNEGTSLAPLASVGGGVSLIDGTAAGTWFFRLLASSLTAEQGNGGDWRNDVADGLEGS